jgi:hypothetical protein
MSNQRAAAGWNQWTGLRPVATRSAEDRRSRGWFIATAFLTLCVSCSSGGTPWLHAVAGAFHPPDLAQDVAAGQAIVAGFDPYAVDFAAWHARVMGVQPEQGYPYLPHPPFALFVTLPLAYASFISAAAAWFAMSIALLAALALLLAEIAVDAAGADKRPTIRTVLAFFGLLLAWPPVLYNLEKGQFSILLAVLTALAWRSLAHRQSTRAGLFLGIAAAVKIFPAILGGYLLLRNRASLVWLIVVGALATLLPLAWVGLDSLSGFVHHSQGNLSYWATWPAITYSVYGLAARGLVGGRWAVPFVHAPAAAGTIVAIASLALIGIAMSATIGKHIVKENEGAPFAAWMTLLVSLNPLSMGHNGVLLALPIVLVARSLLGDRRTWLKLLWSAGVVLASIPRQAVFQLVSIPVEPMAGLLVALPLLGTLLLFAASVAASRPLLAQDVSK